MIFMMFLVLVVLALIVVVWLIGGWAMDEYERREGMDKP